MPTKPIERLMFAQGGRCFFCNDRLSLANASVEHLVGTANGGSNSDDNCVACCKSLNHLLGRLSIKEKLRIVLNQQGTFRCPNGGGTATPAADVRAGDRLAAICADLDRRGAARPRTVKTLSSTINTLFQKSLSESEVAALLAKLQASSVVAINGTKVSYPEPPGDGGTAGRA